MKAVEGTPEESKRLVDAFTTMGDELRHQFIEVDTSGSMDAEFKGDGLEGITKLDVAKTLLQEEAHRRFGNGPLFGLAFFDTEATTVMPIGGDLHDMLRAIGRATPDNSTCIREAVEHGLNALAGNPSPVDFNHLVIVTDAEDQYKPGDASSHAERAKRKSIIVDVILICPSEAGEPVAAEGLQALCTATGGRFAVVHDAEGLKTIFREVAARPIALLT